MPKTVVAHGVVELDRRLQGKSERAEVIGRYATNVTDHVAADGATTSRSPPTSTTWRACRRRWLPPPEDTAAQERHGVIQPVIAYVEK